MVAIAVVMHIMAIAHHVATIHQGLVLPITPIAMAAYGYPATGAGTGGTAAYGLADTGGKPISS